MDIIKKFVKLETGADIRVVNDADNNPCYLGKEIAKLIGIRKLDSAMHGFMEEQIMIDDELFITEDGVYNLFFKYDKPVCKLFQKWTFKVIQSIEKTGKYDENS